MLLESSGKEFLKKEVKRSFAKGGYFIEETYPFIFKKNFLTLAITVEIKPNIIGSQISSVLDDSLRDLLGFDSVVICKKKVFQLTQLKFYPLIKVSSKLILLKETFLIVNVQG